MRHGACSCQPHVSTHASPGFWSCFPEEAHTPSLSQGASRGQHFHLHPEFLAPASEVIDGCVSCVFVGDFGISPPAPCLLPYWVLCSVPQRTSSQYQPLAGGQGGRVLQTRRVGYSSFTNCLFLSSKPLYPVCHLCPEVTVPTFQQKQTQART